MMGKNKLCKVNIWSLKNINVIILALIFIMLLSVITGFFMPSTAQSMDESREIQVKDRLNNILSGREFLDEVDNRSFLNDIGRFLKETIKSILKWIKEFIENNKYTGPKIFLPFTGPEFARALGWVLKILGILIIPTIIILIFYFVSKNIRISKRKKILEDAEILENVRDPNLLLEMALNCKNKGDYRQALRYLYLSILVEYNKRNIIKINKSKTNRQYIYEIKQNNPASFEIISEFTNAFNEHWYGLKSLYLGEYERWQMEYSRLIEGGKR